MEQKLQSWTNTMKLYKWEEKYIETYFTLLGHQAMNWFLILFSYNLYEHASFKKIVNRSKLSKCDMHLEEKKNQILEGTFFFLLQQTK